MPGVRVLLSFNRASDLKLLDFSNTVGKAMTANALFAKPPVTMEQLTAATKEFADALATKASGGGASSTSQRDVKRAVLLDLLGTLANYVQVACKNDLTTLLSSGFSSVVRSTTRAPLPQPQILSINPAMSTQLAVRIRPIRNARSYEARVSSVADQWQSGGIFSSSRGMVIGNLKPGTVYTVQIRAIGGSTGYSDWSDPTSHMA
ncbi:MAG: fibronectin type III domain-containing protein, partial [Verrucomicrobiota bacterium]